MKTALLVMANAIFVPLWPATASAAVLRVPEDIPSIQQAIDAADDGDVVLVAPGRYKVKLAFKGDHKRIVLASWFLTTGERKYIGRTVLQAAWARSSLLRFRREYVIEVPPTCHPDSEIVGFTLRGGNDGIRCLGRVSIRDNVIAGCRDGIDYEDNSGGVCRGNIIEENRDDGIDLDDAVDVVIENNVIRNNDDDGIEIRLNPYPPSSTPPLSVTVSGNEIAGNGEDGIQLISYGAATARIFHIERNLIHRNAMAAVGCMGNANTVENYEAYGLPERVHVVNNTFADNAYGLLGGLKMAVFNNVFVGTGGMAVRNVAGDSVLTHNLFWNNGIDFENASADPARTLVTNPLLSADYRPKAGSPCIDAGAVAIRFLGELITLPPQAYRGSRPDLGAFEFVPEKASLGTTFFVTAPASLRQTADVAKSAD